MDSLWKDWLRTFTGLDPLKYRSLKMGILDLFYITWKKWAKKQGYQCFFSMKNLTWKSPDHVNAFVFKGHRDLHDWCRKTRNLLELFIANNIWNAPRSFLFLALIDGHGLECKIAYCWPLKLSRRELSKRKRYAFLKSADNG